jgi:membrane protease YdiL (CAAX protease family)
MSTIKTFIRKHSVLIYYALTFAISWGGILLVIGGPGAIPATSEQSTKLLPVAILVMLVGPSVAGLLLTGLVDGRAGFRELLSRLYKWRAGIGWYAVALLTSPVLATLILLALSLLSPDFLPAIFTTNDKASLMLIGIVVGLVVGIFEEIGWTGFAIPRLRLRYGALTTGLIVGLLWAAWHCFVYFWGSGDSSGTFSLAIFLPEFLFLVTVLPVYRVLMVWVYDHTQSLLVAMLMHAIHTAGTTSILVPQVTAVSRVIYYFIFAAALWVIVAVVQRQQTLTRQARGALPG